ncbi:hypothetical protein ACWEG1_12850 [Streptomyces bauhiniae]
MRLSAGDIGVLSLFAYLLPNLALTLGAFSTASPERIRSWAERDSRDTVLQRYVIGTAPGPGVSLFIAAAALAVAVVWLPGHLGTTFPAIPRVLVALALGPARRIMARTRGLARPPPSSASRGDPQRRCRHSPPSSRLRSSRGDPHRSASTPSSALHLDAPDPAHRDR